MGRLVRPDVPWIAALGAVTVAVAATWRCVATQNDLQRTETDLVQSSGRIRQLEAMGESMALHLSRAKQDLARANALATQATAALDASKSEPFLPGWRGDPDSGWICDRVPCNPGEKATVPRDLQRRNPTPPIGDPLPRWNQSETP